MLGDGVVASGTVHALCAASANTHNDLTRLVSHVTLADRYVRLAGEPGEMTRRLAGRQGITSEELEGHRELQERYQSYADSIFARIDRVVVDVVAHGSPQQVAEDIVARLER